MVSNISYSRNLFANWVGYGTNLLVMFFLSPFMIHNLGAERYGVWALVVTICGYLGLAEIGIRVSTGRYINFYLGRGEPEKANAVVNTSLVFYALLGIVLIPAAWLGGNYFGVLFTKFPPNILAEVKWVLPLFGLNIWLRFFAVTFAQLLHARDRFDLRNVADVVVLLARGVAIVLVLSMGYGLIALALVEIGASILACISLFILARARGFAVQYRLRHWDTTTLRKLFGFGVWAFMGHLGMRTVYYANSAVIGIMLGAEKVAFYAIGLMLIDAAHTLVGALPQQVLKPTIERIGATDEMHKLRWLLVRSTRLSMFVALPMLIGFITLGREFIELWIHDKRFEQSADVLAILAVSQFAAIIALPCHSTLRAIGRVRLTAMIVLLEGILIVVLGVVLILYTNLGIVGVALSALVSMMLFEGVILPLVTSRTIGFSVWEYIRQIYAGWILSALLLLGPGMVIAHLALPFGWGWFALKVALLTIVYIPIGCVILLGYEDRMRILRALGICLPAIRMERIL